MLFLTLFQSFIQWIIDRRQLILNIHLYQVTCWSLMFITSFNSITMEEVLLLVVVYITEERLSGMNNLTRGDIVSK